MFDTYMIKYLYIMQLRRTFMTSYKITNKKDFMSKLLVSDCFDSFLLKEATIHGFVPFIIDGHINKEFFQEGDSDESPLLIYEYIQWKNIRPICFDLIKGKRTPTKFMFVLYSKPEAMATIFTKENLSPEKVLVQNMILNIRFEQGEMSMTTAIDYSGFTLEKQAEQLWDQTIRTFLIANKISFE